MTQVCPNCNKEVAISKELEEEAGKATVRRELEGGYVELRPTVMAVCPHCTAEFPFAA